MEEKRKNKWIWREYLNSNPDLQKNWGTPLLLLVHFLMFGILERRASFDSTDANFDEINTLYITDNNRRFGNAIIGIVKAIYLSEKYKFNIVFKKEYNFIKLKNLKKYRLLTIRKKRVSLKDIFFTNIPHKDIVYPDFLPRIIKNNIELKFSQKFKLDFDHKNTLIIHIRSGDIIKHYHQWYIQPPFQFYKKIIDDFNFKNIIIVTEPDMKNPCIEMIKKHYPQTIIQSSSLEDDIYTISNAQYLVIGKGTFGPIMALLSKKLKILFIPEYEDSIKLLKKQNSFFVASYKLKDYQKNNFKKNEEKIKIMTEFKDVKPNFDSEIARKIIND